jgi:hypothetical protein
MVYIQHTLLGSIRFGLVSTILMIILLKGLNELVHSIVRPMADSRSRCMLFVFFFIIMQNAWVAE